MTSAANARLAEGIGALLDELSAGSGATGPGSGAGSAPGDGPDSGSGSEAGGNAGSEGDGGAAGDGGSAGDAGDSDASVRREVRLSVSVLALGSGLSATYGSQSFDTASIVKVDILAALLLQAQDEERALTAEERDLAAVMIRESDNDAADALWDSIGRAEGLDAANERLGLGHTSGGPEGHWGLTQTTSADQISLLQAVFSARSPLDADSRRYVQELMGTVVDDQQWGISAAADGEFELKNGWLPRSQTDLWDVNSIGRITWGGQRFLIAVVSDGHPTEADGIAAVEAAAEAAVAAVTTPQGTAGRGV
ncbi:hypothetical protein D7294_25320 [Streptomyces hoynatensis]|uniref:Beta-lactamase class A catalytic domain-containing protein n=1 Tax=Streptomyces hoynatensis TaxID=1141874 RepID=A0A3A9YQP4_9ACTN|nr:hypothetical protein D7294_25320 [Streptomyces hoynatensis]